MYASQCRTIPIRKTPSFFLINPGGRALLLVAYHGQDRLRRSAGAGSLRASTINSAQSCIPGFLKSQGCESDSRKVDESCCCSSNSSADGGDGSNNRALRE